MGGIGLPAPFGNWKNIYRFVWSYKDGRYQRIYGSAMNELKQASESLAAGRPVHLSLCNRLRDKQQYLFGTYSDKIFVPAYKAMPHKVEKIEARPVFDSGLETVSQ
jgi:hypothetical protein